MERSEDRPGEKRSEYREIGPDGIPVTVKKVVVTRYLHAAGESPTSWRNGGIRGLTEARLLIGRHSTGEPITNRVLTDATHRMYDGGASDPMEEDDF